MPSTAAVRLFDDPATRDEFRHHARRLYEMAELVWPPRQLLVYAAWLKELDAWESGPPPLAPGAWPLSDDGA